MSKPKSLFLLTVVGLLLLVAARFYMYVLLEPVLIVHHPEQPADAIVVMAGEPGRRLPPVARLYLGKNKIGSVELSEEMVPG